MRKRPGRATDAMWLAGVPKTVAERRGWAEGMGDWTWAAPSLDGRSLQRVQLGLADFGERQSDVGNVNPISAWIAGAQTILDPDMFAATALQCLQRMSAPRNQLIRSSKDESVRGLRQTRARIASCNETAIQMIKKGQKQLAAYLEPTGPNVRILSATSHSAHASKAANPADTCSAKLCCGRSTA